MNLSELLLATYAALGVLVLAAWRRLGPVPWRGVAILGPILVVAALVFGTHRLAAAPIIGVALVAALWAALRGRRAAGAVRGRRGILRGIGRWTAALALFCLVALDAAFITIFDPLSNDPVRELIAESRGTDFSRLGWPEAFDRLNDRLARSYAMTEWKRIDWASMHERTAPRIAEAARTNDRAAYYLALREYLWSVPDGHIDLGGDDSGLRGAAIRGGFGLALLRLDEGRVIAHVVTDGGPAAIAGLRWGATILSWNDLPIDEAAARASTLWNPNPPATNEGIRLARLKWLARAPGGSHVTIGFRNPEEATARTATLQAVDDQFAPLRATARSENFSFRSPVVEWRVLPEGIGYLRIRAELPTLPQPLPERAVRRAVEEFNRSGVRGVVIDARSNIGGADKLVPRIMSFFVDEPQFYERATLYDDRTERFEVQPAATLRIEPRRGAFRGPVAVLVDERCASSGEGLALVANRRSGGHVVGFHGTYGSFGMSGAEILMPEGLTVGYASGQSLDADGHIQLDSDWRLEGGVAPDVRVPLTIETARAQYLEERDVVLETAVTLLK